MCRENIYSSNSFKMLKLLVSQWIKLMKKKEKKWGEKGEVRWAMRKKAKCIWKHCIHWQRYKYLVYIDLLTSLYFGHATCFKKQTEIHIFVHEVCLLDVIWQSYWVLFCCYKAVSFYCPNMFYQRDLIGSQQNCYDNKNSKRAMIAKFPSTVTQLWTRSNINAIEEEKCWATKCDSCHMRHTVKLILPKDMSWIYSSGKEH